MSKLARRLKIGIVFDDSLDRPDGVQQYIFRMSEWLSSRGHEVHLLVGETKRTDLENVHQMSRNMQVRFNGNTMSVPLPTSKKVLQRKLNELELDVLHVQAPYSPLMAGRLMRLASEQTAVVGTFHILPYTRLVTIANIALGWMNSASARTLDRMMAVSEPAKEFALRTYRYDAQVVPNPIRVADFTCPVNPDTVPRIVFLGRLVERKGAMWLLKAVAYMREQGLYAGDFEVIVGGKGELLPDLLHFVEEHQLETIVNFPGFVPEDEKAALLAGGDITVFPSTSGESFGISLLEALAASRGVVLAGDNPGYSSVMYGFPDQLFDPKATPDFAKLLADWLKDAEARKEIRKKQHDYVRQFDIEVVGKAVEDVYYEALQSKRLA